MSKNEKPANETVHPYAQYVDRVANVRDSLDKAIKSIAQRMGTVRRDVAIAAAACVLHSVQNGNATVASQLVDAIKGMRQNALRDWFLAFGPYSWDEEAEAFKIDRDKRDVIKKRLAEDGNHLSFAKAMLSNPFWEWKPEPVFKPFVLKDVLIKALAQATKRASKADERDNLQGMDDLRTFINMTFTDPVDPITSNSEDDSEDTETEIITVGTKKKAA